MQAAQVDVREGKVIGYIKSKLSPQKVSRIELPTAS
jgi:hypothetical protein